MKLIQVECPALYVQKVTLNRPEASNALNTAMAEELRAHFLGVNPRQDDSIRVILITGAGDRAFCAGADLKERNGMSDEAWFRQHRIFEEMGAAITDCPLPLIAAIHGAAFGGGCELAMTCDILLASPEAIFAQTEVKLGIIPGLGGTQRLPRLIGPARAKELIFSGGKISAEQAEKWGLVNRVCAPGKLQEDALRLASDIAANGPLAVRQAKRAIDGGATLPIHEALAFEIEAYNQTVQTQDRAEGITAFNEKRKPKFIGK